MSFSMMLFLIVGGVTVGAAAGVVISKSVFRAAVWLLFTLVGVALLYFLLGAEFLAATQLIVYVGGTLVLVVFGSMLTAGGPFTFLKTRPFEWLAGTVLAVCIAALIINAAVMKPMVKSKPQELPGIGQLGMSFLGIPDANNPKGATFLLPFEIVSVHLLVVLVGAAYLARAKKRMPKEGATP